MSTAVHTWSPNKLWRSNSIFNVWFLRKVTLGPEILVYQHILEAEELGAGTTGNVTKPTENTGDKKR
jgi:hypothetical protein